ncbi:MAG: hypothetical protein PVG25_11610, partial [Anaerolineae bacterium]
MPEVVREAQLELNQLMASLSGEGRTASTAGGAGRMGRPAGHALATECGLSLPKSTDGGGGQTSPRSAVDPAETGGQDEMCPV